MMAAMGRIARLRRRMAGKYSANPFLENQLCRVDKRSASTMKVIGSEEAVASVCPQNRAYGSVHGSSRKPYPLLNIKPMR